VDVHALGLGRNRWHYPSFDSTHPPARYVPSGPHTTPLTPIFLNRPTELFHEFPQARSLYNSIPHINSSE
jgi:hypothetical protein